MSGRQRKGGGSAAERQHDELRGASGALPIDRQSSGVVEASREGTVEGRGSAANPPFPLKRQALVLDAAPLSLEGIDALAGVDLLAFVALDERPLRGLAGLVDWRLCGALSRSLRAGHFRGEKGESLLTVDGSRWGGGRIFLHGVGAVAKAAHSGPDGYVFDAMATAARAGARRVATWLPPWGGAPINQLARAAVEAAREQRLESLTFLHGDVRAADRALAIAAETFPGVRLVGAG